MVYSTSTSWKFRTSSHKICYVRPAITNASSDMKKWEANYRFKCLSNTYCDGSSDPLVLGAGDCLVRIKSWSRFFYRLLEECTNINFAKWSVLGTFIRKQRPDDCLTWNCTHDFRIHVMDNILIYLTWISCTTLVSDLWVDRMPKSCQTSSLRNNTPIFINLITHVCWQIIAGIYPNATIIIM
jgi:hypothetical protein